MAVTGIVLTKENGDMASIGVRVNLYVMMVDGIVAIGFVDNDMDR